MAARSVVRKLGGFEFVGTEPEFTGYTARVDVVDPEKLRPGRNLTASGMYLQSQPGYIVIQDFDGGAFHSSEKPITLGHVQDGAAPRLEHRCDTSALCTLQPRGRTEHGRSATYRNESGALSGRCGAHSFAFGRARAQPGRRRCHEFGLETGCHRPTAGRQQGLLDSYHRGAAPARNAGVGLVPRAGGDHETGPEPRALHAVVRDLMNTRDGASYFAGRVRGVDKPL